jgi:hypothetical protein
VADYQASELTMREWCEQNGFRVDQLRYWLKKARDAGLTQSPLWACVELVDEGISGTTKMNPTSTSGTAVTVRVGAATIELRPGFDPVLLAEALRVVVATC